MHEIWKYLTNQFLIATLRNFKKAMKLSNYHDAALAEAQLHDPALVPIYARYHPLHEALRQRYNAWKAAGGTQKGKTSALEQKLDNLTPTINDWDARTQTVYPKGSPRYIELFPNGHRPFTNGSIEERINAFDSFSLAIGSDANPVMMAIKTEAIAKFSELDDARDKQAGAKGTKKVESGQLSEDVKNAMNMQYRNLGFCMDTFFDDLETIANALFDQQTLRDLQQTDYNISLNANETKNILRNTFLDDDELEIEITCTETTPASASVSLYLATTASGTNSTAVNILINNGKIIITAEQFGNLNFGTHRFLNAVNNTSFDVVVKVKLL
jgi:hypothetical protein